MDSRTARYLRKYSREVLVLDQDSFVCVCVYVPARLVCELVFNIMFLHILLASILYIHLRLQIVFKEQYGSKKEWFSGALHFKKKIEFCYKC